MPKFMLRWPGRIVFGAGTLASLPEELHGLGNHAFLATTPELTALGLAERVHRLLESSGVAVTRFEDVQPDPSCGTVDDAARQARSAGCDFVVGLGGGSAIDLAKAVSVAATHPGPIWEYVTYTGANAKPVTAAAWPVIAIPTTAGTGSEVTNGAVLDNPKTHMKAALLSPHITPRLAVVDPELTYSMPKRTAAMTGFDTMTHGIESFLNAARCNPASDLFALETVRSVAKYLPHVLADGGDRVARSQVSWAATLGGLSIALSNASVAHAMALPLGARCGVAHGLALSRLQPVVLAHSWQAQTERCAILAQAVGAAQPGMNERAQAEALASWLKEFVCRIGLDELWADAGIDGSQLDLLTEDVFAYMGRPVQQHLPVFTPTEIRQMFAEALAPTQP